MRNVLCACFMVSLAFLLASCAKPCDIYPPMADQLKKYSFKAGSFWVYQDSASGVIDSQSVYAYSAKNHMELGSNTRDGVTCTAYADVYSMGIASFRNGVLYDSISIGNDIYIISAGTEVYYHKHPFESSIYIYSAIGDSATATLTNFTVSGQTFPKVYREVSNFNSLAYSVDNIGVVKWVFNDTINGQNTWNLVRYHVINP